MRQDKTAEAPSGSSRFLPGERLVESVRQEWIWNRTQRYFRLVRLTPYLSARFSGDRLYAMLSCVMPLPMKNAAPLDFAKRGSSTLTGSVSFLCLFLFPLSNVHCAPASPNLITWLGVPYSQAFCRDWALPRFAYREADIFGRTAGDRAPSLQGANGRRGICGT